MLCTSAITAMGIGAIVKRYYPGYTAKIISEKYQRQFANCPQTISDHPSSDYNNQFKQSNDRSSEYIRTSLQALYGNQVTTSDIRAWCAMNGTNYRPY